MHVAGQAVGVCFLALLLGSADSSAQQRGVISGKVIRTPGAHPIRNVEMSLVGADRSTRSDSLGHFEFRDLREGGYIVQAKAAGYQAVNFGVILGRNEHLELDVELARDSVTTIPELVTEAEGSALDRMLEGFYSRMQDAQGTFITPQQLAMQRPALMSNILRWVPGLNVSCRSMATNTCIVTFERSNPEANRFGCPVMFYLDGVRYGPMREDLDALIPAHQVAAVEAYRGIGHLPKEFGVGGSQCGVIAVWLKPNRE